MALIKSISGIRGTIGGTPGESLTPTDIVMFAAAYSSWLKKCTKHSNKLHVVIGRDARISGEMVNNIIKGTLIGSGINVTDLGLATTPTVEVAVTKLNADGGIILTASHNPKQWNALKLLNAKGEFISGDDAKLLLSMADKQEFNYVDVDDLGTITENNDLLSIHIKDTLALKQVNVEAIRNAKFKVVVDAVNSVGGIAIPALLKELGVECIKLNCEPTGHFAHNPEPLPEHLTEISKLVPQEKADLGIVVDPDVDRLALICENGEMFGEEYTLVAVADYLLGKYGAGNTVSNLSSSRALRDVTESYGGKYYASAVGEVNVVAVMKKENAIVGGEGNGGIIFPDLHYGRDSLVGVALFLSHLAEKGIKASELRAGYPEYHMSKNKVELSKDTDVDALINKVKQKYSNEKINEVDGVRIDFEAEKKWVHMRKSNTEPVIRIYSEASSVEKADALAKQIMADLK